MTSCTLIPSGEYLKSDTLDPKMEKEKILGTYKPTPKSLKKLQRHFSNDEIEKLRKSIIRIYSKGDSIKTFYMPVNAIDSTYYLSTSTSKLNIRTGHEKFWHLRRRSNYWPDIKFRLKNGKPSLLVNLNTDPDGFDYYEYKKE